MARPAHVETFIQTLLPVARKVRATYGVPISVCIAQAAVESGWNAANKSPFGVAKKGDPSQGFVQYGSLEEAAMAYGRNLRYNPVYAAAWFHQNDPDKFVDAIAEKYAPKQNYGNTVKAVIRQQGLTEYDDEMLYSPSGMP